jgi:MoaA/NifB/PqqE/SkfB family radical SAM enzyme
MIVMSAATVTPDRVRLEASTVCQLKCPSCPTTTGEIGKHLKSGFLTLDDFRRFVDDNHWIEHVELSNWGEVLLNPELLDILRYAYEKGVSLTLSGANLNTAKPDVLEGLVKYRLRHLNCSIDGATPETYSVYRVRGDFNRVISNTERINELKRKYRSPYPELTWQFVAFSHNEHEIHAARAMAERLNMGFALKLNWDDLYDQPFAPVRDHARVASESGLGVATRAEFRQKFGRGYSQRSICREMWTAPQINFDGRVLGCCVNYWGDYGNAFRDGLLNVLNNERMQYARRMLRGEAAERTDIPCTSCKFYREMKADASWITDADLGRPASRIYAAALALVPTSATRLARRLEAASASRVLWFISNWEFLRRHAAGRWLQERLASIRRGRRQRAWRALQ